LSVVARICSYKEEDVVDVGADVFVADAWQAKEVGSREIFAV
jgi:hypothetical protein